MATVFKRQDKRNWYIDYFDHTGKRISRSSNTTDKAAATRIANKLEAEVALRVDGVIDVRAEDKAKLATLPIKIHLDAYRSARTSKSGSDHIEATITIIEKMGFNSLGEITADKVNNYTLALGTEGRALRTIAAHIQAIKGFTR